MGKTKISLVLILTLFFSIIPMNIVFAESDIDFEFSKSEYNKMDLIEGKGKVDIDVIKGKDLTYTVEDKDGDSIYKIGQDKIDMNGGFSVSFRLPKSISDGVYYLRMNVGGEHKEYNIKISSKEEAGKENAGTDIPSKPIQPTKPEEKKYSFEDIKNHWAKDEIQDLIDMKILNGVNKRDFKPNKKITRAEFVKIMVEALELEIVDGDSPYLDIKESDWHYNYILTASKANLVKGKSKDKFSPNDEITREEMAVIIYRSMENKKDIDSISKFKDRDKISKWAVDAVDYIYDMKIIEGDKSNNFKPKQFATRAEASVVIWRLLKMK